MKRIFISILLCTSLLIGCSADDKNSDNENVIQTNDFTVYDSNMQEVQLSDFFGKPIVVNFWATWCPPCRSELPAFENMYQKYKETVVFLMVNLTDGQRDTVSIVNEFISHNEYTFPVYYDIEYNASNTYEVYSIPETLFINSDGSLFNTEVGAISETTLERYIKQMLN